MFELVGVPTLDVLASRPIKTVLDFIVGAINGHKASIVSVSNKSVGPHNLLEEDKIRQR